MIFVNAIRAPDSKVFYYAIERASSARLVTSGEVLFS